MSAEERPECLTAKLTQGAFVAACVTMAVATVMDLAGLEWRWLLRVSGSFFILSGLFALGTLRRREDWEPTPLRLRHWLVRIPGALVAFVFMWIGVFQWTR